MRRYWVPAFAVLATVLVVTTPGAVASSHDQLVVEADHRSGMTADTARPADNKETSINE